jgi:hypothetical protein
VKTREGGVYTERERRQEDGVSIVRESEGKRRKCVKWETVKQREGSVYSERE